MRARLGTAASFSVRELPHCSRWDRNKYNALGAGDSQPSSPARRRLHVAREVYSRIVHSSGAVPKQVPLARSYIYHLHGRPNRRGNRNTHTHKHHRDGNDTTHMLSYTNTFTCTHIATNTLTAVSALSGCPAMRGYCHSACCCEDPCQHPYMSVSLTAVSAHLLIA